MLSQESWDNIAQVKSLRTAVREDPDNIAQGKKLFNIVSILLGQHCTGKLLVQCCPRGLRQHCTGKKNCSMLSQYSWDNIAQVNYLFNVVQEA